MGNYRFKFSDMMPNAWFYKLRDMGRSSKNKTTACSRKKNHSFSSVSSKPKQSQQCNPRKSYYFTRDLTPTDRIIHSLPKNPNSPEAPRKSSSKQRTKRKTSKSSPKLVSSSVSAGCSCRATLESMWNKSDSPPEYSSWSPFDTSPEESEFPEPQFRTDRVLPTESFDEMVFWSNNSNSCSCRRNSNADDIVIDVDNNSIVRKDDKLNENGYDSFSKLQLPPIITKPAAEFHDSVNDAKKKESKSGSKLATFDEQKSKLQKSLKVKIVKEEQRNSSLRRFSVSSPGVRLRIHSPRIASRKAHQTNGRKSTSSRRSLSDSFAIVKSSHNPQRDFRESMVEMIVENNIRNSKDMEDLLACYLSLNSDEYHDLIIKVFKQIWLDLTDNA